MVLRELRELAGAVMRPPLQAAVSPAAGASASVLKNDSDKGHANDLLGWSDDLLTGDDNIDSQHKYIVKLLTDIREAQVLVRDRAAMIGHLEKLSSFLKLHFHYEEKLLRRRQYPKRKEIAGDHEHLLRQCEAVLSYARTERVIESRFVTLLLYGLLSHIRTEAGVFVTPVQTDQ